MTPKFALKHGNMFPFDASNKWWDSNGRNMPPAEDNAHRAARGIIADLGDRRGIKQGFTNLDESTRVEIIKSLAAIIREAYK